MAYAMLADLEAWLGERLFVQLTDDAGTGGADLEKATTVLSAAEGEVNSYLARRYAVPVDVNEHPEVGALLKGVVLDLAAYGLHCRRPPVPEEVRVRRQAAVIWLGRVADGQVVLPGSGEVSAGEIDGFPAQAVGAVRVLNRETLNDL